MVNNSVKKCCICNNKNIGEFITINDNKYHLCCIEDLKQENELLKRNCNIGNENLDFYRQQYKELHNKIDKTIRMLEINIEITRQQPSNNKLEDKFFINRCNNLIKILKDSDVDE